MNVKVCAFPDGEDPDSFAKKMPYEELIKYLEENSKDFIQFKASLLMNEAKNDPIKKADLIRDMVVSLSKIPDRIEDMSPVPSPHIKRGYDTNTTNDRRKSVSPDFFNK